MSEGPPGRRTLGRPPRPGSRYASVVGLVLVALIAIAVIELLGSDDGVGLSDEETDLPLPEFAMPAATGSVEGDANIAQDDCETSELPCPADSRRRPACEVRGRGIVTLCDFFDRPLVLSFWFSASGDCVAQQDVVSELARRYRGRVAFVSIDIGDDRDEVRELVRERGWRMPVGYDRDGAAASLYRVGICPSFVFAYPGGLLQSASAGKLDAAELERRVRTLLRDSRRRLSGR